MDTVIYIVGPTGVGKTALAANLAKKFNGELINADSVQVYEGLDIISGKDHPKDVSLNLLDVVTPSEPFSVSHFQKLGEETISKILLENKLPIVVGGTGLYIKSLIDGIPTKDVRSDDSLRSKLESLSVEDLQKMLTPKKLEKMNDSDRKNKRRLIRAVEIEKAGFQDYSITIPFPRINHLQIGLFTERQIINKRIDKRVEERLRKGALEEALRLFSEYESLTEQVKNTNGYKQLFEYLRGNIALDEAANKWKISEHQLAKNQMTWFKKDSRINWFNINDKDFEAGIEELVKRSIL